MILPQLIVILFIGAIAALFSERIHLHAPRWLAIAALILDSLLLTGQWLDVEPIGLPMVGNEQVWFAEFNQPWIPRFGIAFHLALDGVSLLLIMLTAGLGLMAVSSSWTEIKERQGFFYFNLLACLSGTIGVFLAVDLFLFFFFWELMIIPMYFLIAIWGHENRIYAAMKFLIFTQASSLLLLLAIIVLAFIHHSQMGIMSFDYFKLQNAVSDPDLAFWLMLGFFIAFAVKLPVIPFHTWLPDAHTQAPTGGSIILAGIMLKTGAYGLLRFVFPLFPDTAHTFAPIAMTLAAVSTLYGAMTAYAQTDLKRMIAYTSVSHMGFVLLGVFSWNLLALQGSVMTMLAHGISASALFMIAGILQERLHTRELNKMGGLWSVLPKLSAVTLLFALASLGLPGLGNFIGEFLVLLGAFKVNAILTALTALALILSPVYALFMVQKALQGTSPDNAIFPDLTLREFAALSLLMVSIVWLGLVPNSVINVSASTLQQELQRSQPIGRL